MLHCSLRLTAALFHVTPTEGLRMTEPLHLLMSGEQEKSNIVDHIRAHQVFYPEVNTPLLLMFLIMLYWPVEVSWSKGCKIPPELKHW